MIRLLLIMAPAFAICSGIGVSSLIEYLVNCIKNQSDRKLKPIIALILMSVNL